MPRYQIAVLFPRIVTPEIRLPSVPLLSSSWLCPTGWFILEKSSCYEAFTNLLHIGYFGRTAILEISFLQVGRHLIALFFSAESGAIDYTADVRRQ